ncbi:major facilitator superfamily domain-containing protein [Mycena albidolilacea]|uniref:Major facilitator superfamily domain-containing protein n=1 Tax=Mycena albidolilacea TaxID=1033008 RepID=A0AAD7ADE7_9AGAR|nr:major facilitator superfamily domain-containing protein [Mycena albidolilacea]
MKTEDLVETTCSEASGDELPQLNSAVRRKVDLRLIPLVTILYLCCFLDRSNLGNARIAGMAEDLKLSGMRYQVAAAAFFITYSLLEIPCNILLKLLRPSIWIPSMTLAWGIVMVSMSFVKTWQGLIIARSFLGIAESGLAPALAFYISSWYRHDEQARPIACYFSAATLAGAFGGLLAFGIEKMNGIGGLHGWSWIFLLEGLITVIISLVAYWAMVDFPSTATFLSSIERENLVEVLRRDTEGEPSHFEKKFVWEALMNPKSWLQALIFIGVTVPIYSFTLFLPTIIHAMGFSATNAQLLTIPPYAVGCVSTIRIGVLSDRSRTRGPFITAASLFAIIGYTMLLATNPETQPGVGYAGCIIVAMGIFPGVPLTLAWSGGNAGGSLKKAVTFGFIGMIGNLGGICASFVYRTQDSPRFRLGHGIMTGFLCLTFFGSLFGTVLYRRLNRAKEHMCTESNISLDKKAELSALGIDSPVFRYVL